MRTKNYLISTLLLAVLASVPFNTFGQVGYITILAGNGTGAYGGDGGVATSASLNHPIGISIDISGNVYIADHDNNRIRKVTPAGIISTVAGNGIAGFSGDGGPATAARLKEPYSVYADAVGNLYIADAANNRIRMVNASGIISTIAGTGTGGSTGDGIAATAAQLYFPVCVRKDNAGNIYIADNGNQKIRKINTSGIITTIAGTGLAGYSGDGGPATNARLRFPSSVWVDPATGNILIADSENSAIRKITPSGIITTVAGTGTAGSGPDGGMATASAINRPQDVITDNSGNIIVCDNLNNRVRKVDASGIVTTIVGTGTYGFSGDGGPATAATLRYVNGLAFDAAGFIYLADVLNHRVRRIAVPVPGTPPAFTEPDTVGLLLCTGEMTGTSSIDTLLEVLDADAGQTLTWTLVTAPSHGVVTGGVYTTTATGSTVTPSGYVYTATPGYTGTDIFTFQVSDGTDNDVIAVKITVEGFPSAGVITGTDTLCAGDTAVLAASVASGIWSTDGTGITTVSGTGVVTAIMSGANIITYTVSNSCGSAVATLPVTVRDPKECITMFASDMGIASPATFPNPATGRFSIRLNNATEAVATVSNLTGQVVGQYRILPYKSVDVVLNVPAGIYFLRASDGKVNRTEKIIIIK